MRRLIWLAATSMLVLGSSCSPDAQPTQEEKDRARPPEATSLFGEPLVPPLPTGDARAKMEAQLADARSAYEKQPNDADAIIWLGRRTAYLGRFREAIDIFSLGVDKHPDDARFHRHRGHRYITTRRFVLAIADLDKAARLVAGKPDEVEPDGQPNARGIPTSTLQTNIYYHLGLAHYLNGDFDRALSAYRECLERSKNNDMQVASRHWLYMTLRRLNRPEDAAAVLEPVSADMEIIENASYHKLLLVYKGLEAPDALLSKAGQALDRATIGYGIGNWYLYNGQQDKAVSLFREILAGDQWTSFGAAAAEADLKRLGVPKQAT